MKKRILAFVLAAVLVISSAMSVLAAEAATYEVTDAGWWAGNAGAEIEIDSDIAEVTYTVEVLSDVTDWGFEIYDGEGRYISNFSYAGSWYFEATGDDLTGTVIEDATTISSLAQGTYTVIITRVGTDFSIIYYDTDGTTVIGTLYATNTDIATPAYIHFYAQYGSFSVSGIETTAVSAEDVTVEVGCTKSAVVTTNPSDLAGAATITYSITDGADYAEIDEDGTITGIDEGEATVEVTCTYGEFTYTTTFTVYVTPHNAVTGISASVTSATVAEGSTLTVVPAYSYEDDTKTSTTDTVTVTYTSSDESVAAVDENGVITAVSAGTATITITVVATGEVDGEEYTNTFTATVEITVTEAATADSSTDDDSSSSSSSSSSVDESTASDTDSDASDTDADSDSSAKEATAGGDISVLLYVVLLAGAAAAIVVITRKKVTE